MYIPVLHINWKENLSVIYLEEKKEKAFFFEIIKNLEKSNCSLGFYFFDFIQIYIYGINCVLLIELI